MDLTFPTGETVVVTGAGSGIGRETALLAARAGLRVAAWDLTAQAVADTVDTITAAGGTAVASTVDVADPAAVRTALAADGPARYLVNNAGPASSTEFDFDRALALTVGSVRTVTDAWLAGRPEAGAAVVNVASVAGNLVGTDSAWYCAGKAAIAGYTRHLATRLAPTVRANAVAPGLIDTPRTAGFAATALGRDLVARNPMGRAGRPEEVAAVVLFLLSPLAGYLNGVLLPADGGWTVTQ
ncbi:SDR family NAD(P)-dependent oxidoreductase [Micromonospora echinospora]|uniref:SDR family NAD(P)-dependent oxidoreductase n=1 Tax=Micromonospora echinospora TaxID=1877 RepID=UPI003A87B830